MDEKTPPKSNWKPRADGPSTDQRASGEVADARRRRIGAMQLQVIEDNPLTEAEISMFEMFEREGWSHERRLSHIRALALAAAGK
jgi:hypothetical protein